MAKEISVPVPSEDNIGYEIVDANDMVVGEVTIAWPEKKIGLITTEMAESKPQLEELGWKVFDATNIADMLDLFGGDR